MRLTWRFSRRIELRNVTALVFDLSPLGRGRANVVSDGEGDRKFDFILRTPHPDPLPTGEREQQHACAGSRRLSFINDINEIYCIARTGRRKHLMLDKLDNKPGKAIDPAVLSRFAAIVGDKYAITDPSAHTPYLVEMRDLFRGRTPMVLRPGTVAEVSAILKLASETITPIVPQGGNTGLVGGQIPHHNEIVLSLNRLDRIREVDPTSYTITCEAGVTLARAREAAAAVDRLYPQLLPSEGTCTIGGNLSTNAGGTAALAYGVARAHALGLEVVLADGRIMNNLNKLKKDNTGYDLRDLFIGAEGTLGVITAAVLRMVPKPRSIETAFAGVPSPQAAVDLLKLAEQHTSDGVTSFEMMLRA